ncbi:hypothetical protein ACNKHU_00540 [Shigella flexneri]
MLMIRDQAKAGGAGALPVSRPLDIDLPEWQSSRIRVWRLVKWPARVRQQFRARVARQVPPAKPPLKT